MKFITEAAAVIAHATNGNPVISTVLVGMFYLWVSFTEAIIEKLIFGTRFEHWLDPLIAVVFIVFAAMTVHACAKLNAGGAA